MLKNKQRNCLQREIRERNKCGTRKRDKRTEEREREIIQESWLSGVVRPKYIASQVKVRDR